MQFKVSKEFDGLSEKQVMQILNVVTKFRNVCANNERLFSYKTKNSIPNLKVHKYLNIKLKGNAYSKGIRDLVSIVISLKHLLPVADFDKFKSSLLNMIDYFDETSTTVKKEKILDAMGFPANWMDV